MIIFFSTLSTQTDSFFKDIFDYLKESPVSVVFLLFIVVVLVLNFIRQILIHQEKKRGARDQPCIYLVVEANKQDCSLQKYKKYFSQNGNGCDGCPGKVCSMSDAEAENRIIKSSFWKRILVVIANYSKSALPYISFIYTLTIDLLGKRN